MLIHRLSRTSRAASLLVLSILLTACGGDGDILGTGNGPDPVADPILTGVLLDGPTGGVSFSSGSQSGLTNARGEFRYRLGERVRFSVGGITLGTIDGRSIVTPVELTGSDDPGDQRVRNMLVFLQSIDEDQDHSNGISINAVGRSNAASARLDFSAADFTAQVTNVVTLISGGANSVVSEQQALDNFYATYVSIGGTASVDFPFPGYPPVGGPTQAAIPVDFEGGFTYQFGNFGGGEAVVIDNPQSAGINTSARVAQMVKAAGEVFGGTTLTLDTPVDFSQGEVFTMKVWASRQVPVLFKLEATQSNFVELTATHSGSGAWEELTFDFTGATSGLGAGLVNIVLIFDNGIQGNAANNLADWLFYFDDIAQSSDTGGGGGGGGVVVNDQAPLDFEDVTGTFTFNDFGGGVATIVDNPQTTGNASARVGRMQKFAGELFGGSTLVLDAAVDFSAGEVFTMEVYSERVAALTFKLEGLNVERVVNTSGAGWETMTFDFTGATTGADVTGITLIFDNGIAGDAANDAANWTFYFDDLQLTADGGGGAGGALLFSDDFESGDLAGWTATPNGGAITADNTQAGGGTFSARLVAGPSQAPALSIESLAAGTVAAGDTIDVSWDMCGSFAGAGEVMFAALLSEPGGDAGAIRVFDTIPTVPAVWTRFTRSFAADADPNNVVGGISVQFDVVCGGDASCAANVFIDNVTITNGAGDPGGAASGASCADGGTGGTGGTGGVSGSVFFDVVDAQWDGSSLSAFDQAIGFASCTDDGGAGCPSIGWNLVAAADTARGNVIEVSYPTGAQFAGLVIGQPATPLDFSRFAGGRIVFDLNVTANPNSAPFIMKVDCTGCPTDAGQREQALGVPAAGWQTFTVAVDDLVNANGGPTAGGLKIDQVTTGLVVFPAFGQTSDVTYQIDNVRWEAAGAVFEEVVANQWDATSLSAFDQAIGFASCTDDGGAGCPSIGWNLVAAADTARGNVIEVSYPTGAQFAGLVIGQPATPLDFSQFAGGSVVFDLNVTANPNSAPFIMKVDCTGCPTDAGQREQALGVPAAGWQTFTVAVDDLINANGGPTAGGLKIDQVTTGLVVFPAFGQTSDVTYQIDNVRWEAAAAGGGTGGGTGGTGTNLAVNGDFETGDLTGWELFPGGGSITADGTQNNGGAFSGRLVATGSASASQDVIFKQANLAVGTVNPGDTISISFDLFGSLAGAGGVVFAEFFSELTGGGVSSAEILSGGPLTPTGTWTTHSFTATAGADVSGGITLQLKAGCGAVDGCVVDAYFDNVSISIQ